MKLNEFSKKLDVLTLVEAMASAFLICQIILPFKIANSRNGMNADKMALIQFM